MAFPVLGTAQLGMSYGVASRAGQPSRATAFAILEAAIDEGIEAFDTAAAYGESEAIIGAFVEAHGLEADVRIITKLGEGEVEGNLERALDASLRRLCVSSLDVLLLHFMPDEESFPDLVERLHACVLDGRARHVGVSVYEPLEALKVLRTEGLSVVQVPTNVFDHRFIRAGVPALAQEEQKKRLDVRSIFLQGLLSLDPAQVPAHLAEAVELLDEWQALAQRAGRSPLDIACAFVRDLPGVGGVLFGAETPEQVRLNAGWWRAESLPPDLRAEINAAFNGVPDSVRDPREWST